MEVWKRHFAGLLSGGVERDEAAEHQAHGILTYINCGRGEHDARAWQLHSKVSERRTLAAELNRPIELAEVIAAIKALRNGRSPGLEKAPAECYRYARQVPPPDAEDKREVNMIAPVLCELLEYIRSTGDVPEQFVVSALTPTASQSVEGSPSTQGGIGA